MRVVPDRGLLFVAAAAGLSAGALWGLLPAWGAEIIAAVVVLALGAALDARLSVRRVEREALSITIECPDVVRLARDREGSIDVFVTNHTQRPIVMSIGLAVPASIALSSAILSFVAEGASGEKSGGRLSRIRFECVPSQRGSTLIDRVYVERPSTLGLWVLRYEQPVAMDLRVYPNLLRERKHLSAMFLNRGLFGLHTHRQSGQGREFEKLREYVPGDSYDSIHWKATARRGEPITKVFQVERTQEVYVVLDSSRLSARMVSDAEGKQADSKVDLSGGEGETMLERFINASLILGLAAERQGDLFGMVTFSNSIHGFVRARNGRDHYNVCRDAVLSLTPDEVSPDFDELFSFLSLRLRKRALLIFLTSLDDPALSESFLENLEMLRRRHLVMICMIRPAEAEPLFSPKSGAPAKSEELYDRLGGHMKWRQLHELGLTFRNRGVGYSLLENERLSADLVRQYLQIKERQLL